MSAGRSLVRRSGNGTITRLHRHTDDVAVDVDDDVWRWCERGATSTPSRKRPLGQAFENQSVNMQTLDEPQNRVSLISLRWWSCTVDVEASSSTASTEHAPGSTNDDDDDGGRGCVDDVEVGE
eukprot:5660537-Amphidinium_carterae.1